MQGIAGPVIGRSCDKALRALSVGVAMNKP